MTVPLTSDELAVLLVDLRAEVRSEPGRPYVRAETALRLAEEVFSARRFALEVVRVAFQRRHDGTQLDADLEGLLLEARTLLMSSSPSPRT